MTQDPGLTYEYHDSSDEVVTSGKSERRVTESTTRRKFLSGMASIAGVGLLSDSSVATNHEKQRYFQAKEDFDAKLQSEIFTIHYYEEFESDAKLIAELLSYARSTVKEFYPHEYSHKVNVYLYRADEWRESSFRTGQWFLNGEVERARIRMVTPSEHSNGGELYYRKNMVHEYTHLPLAVDLRSESGYLKPPGWFNEGLPQYISVFETTEAIKEEYYNKRGWKKVRQQIQDGNGFILDIGSNVYKGGPHLVEFMVKEFGKESVVKIPGTDTTMFGEALQKRIGLNPLEFELRWLLWANNNYDATYEVETYTPDKTVARSKYNELKEEKSNLEDRVDELEKENAALQDQVEELQQRLEETPTPSNGSSNSSPESPNGSERTVSKEDVTEKPTTTESPGFGAKSGVIGGSGYLIYKLRSSSHSEDS